LALRNHNSKKNKNPSVLIATTTKDLSVPLIFLSTTHLILLTATTMTTKRKTDYNIGDRVAERPKSHGIFAVRNEVKDRIQQYRSQRYGTVVDQHQTKSQWQQAEVSSDQVGSPQESHGTCTDAYLSY
jgi:hypothetical protein